MVGFVFRTDAAQNFHSVFGAWFLDFDRLEPAFEGGVFFDVFAIFCQGGGADALHFTAGEGGFDDVAGVHGAFRAPGSDDGMKFVDKEDDVLIAPDLIHDGLDAFFELAAIFGACDHEGEVEGDDFFIAQDFRHIAADDFLSQSFDDGGFANTSFTDEDGIVFGPAAEDLDDPLDFALPPDDWIHFAFLSEFGQVAAEGAQGGHFAVFFPAPGRGRLLATFRRLAKCLRGAFFFVAGSEIRIQFLEDFLAGAFNVDVQRLQHTGGHSFSFTEQTEQNMLSTDITVIQGARFFTSQSEHFFHPRSIRDIAHHLLIGTGADLFLHLHAHRLQVETELLKHVDGDALAQLDQPEQQVFGADVVVVEAVCLFAGERKHLLGSGGKVVHGTSAAREDGD